MSSATQTTSHYSLDSNCIVTAACPLTLNNKTMAFNLISLQEYLLDRFRIPPGWVWLDTCFRQDLSLSESDMKQLASFVRQQTGLDFPERTVRSMTDVFDLLVYVLLQTEVTEMSSSYFDSLVFIGPSSQSDFQPFGTALLQNIHIN